MFEEMTYSIQEESLRMILHVNVESDKATKRQKVAEPTSEGLAAQDGEKVQKPAASRAGKVGRNELCPCGSGKKYKNCCGM